MNFAHLADSVFGSVITSEAAGYPAAREGLVWNGRKPARHPQVIVRAASVGDVQAAVRFAAAQGLRVSARGGGCHWSGVALQEGVAIDLSALDHLRIDAAARTAEVGPAVRNGAAAVAFAAQGLAFPLGHHAAVPVSGYLLGGGIGWNPAEWGIACFGVTGVDVVLANGELVRASATENTDIFWAARGAGPAFFGIVTGYRLALQPLPRAITTSVHTYRIEDAPAVEHWMRACVATAPRNLEFKAVFAAAQPPLAETSGKVAAAVATVFADDEAEAQAILARIAATAPAGALQVMSMPTPFETLYALNGPFFPEGARYAVDTAWAEQPAGLLTRLAVETATAPSRHTFSTGLMLPPAAPLPDAAFSIQGPAFGCAFAIWDDAAADHANLGWLRRTADAMAPLARGAYLGSADLDRAGTLQRCFTPGAWQRLTALRAKYDPTGMFALPQAHAQAA